MVEELKEKELIYGEPRVSYYHEHYCEEKLFAYGKKKKFNCPKKVKYNFAGGDEKCNFCERMLAVYFEDNCKYNKVLKFFRMNGGQKNG